LIGEELRPARGGLLRVAHIIAGLDPIYGGPSYTVPRLCQALVMAGAELKLLSVAGRSDAGEHNYLDRRFPQANAETPVLRGLRRSPALSRALRDIAPGTDVVHGHGLWLMPNLDTAWAAARARKPLIVSPRGMLSPAALAFSRVKKRAFWTLLQRPALRRAACVHATSTQEYEEIRSLGLSNPVAVIPNGIDLPHLRVDSAAYATSGHEVLSLGRIHPKKGLERLLRAWATVEPRYPDWRLRIAGPSEGGHTDALRALSRTLGLTRVAIDGPIYGDAKWDAYRCADLFVLPSLNENFGMTVAEALATATPAISTKGAPWRGLESEACGWWIDHGVEPLVAALESAMALPRERLRRMGANGRAWMARDFSWDRIANDMLDVYRWLAGSSPAPATVRFR
jgi:glycosyltransferase involved in cell wall biosynthesis